MYQYVKLHNSQAFFLLFQHVREFSNIGAWKFHCLRKHLRHSIVLDRKWTHVYQNGRQTFKARKLLLPSVLSIPIVMSVLSTFILLYCRVATSLTFLKRAILSISCRPWSAFGTFSSPLRTDSGSSHQILPWHCHLRRRQPEVGLPREPGLRPL